MKKIFLSVVLTVVTIIFAGCADGGNESSEWDVFDNPRRNINVDLDDLPLQSFEQNANALSSEEAIEQETITPTTEAPAQIPAVRVTAENENQLRAAVAEAGETPVIITITALVELISNFVIPSGTDITLTSAPFSFDAENTFGLIAMRDMDAIKVEENASLIVENIGIGRNRETSTKGSGINNSGNFIMHSGFILGHEVGVHNVGFFTMNNGNINSNGCGVYNDNSSNFIMHDGEIKYNGYIDTTILITSGQGGGGICNSAGSTFTMNGGIISDNRSGNGGGVYNIGVFTMNDGEINNNHISGVANVSGYYKGDYYYGTFTMNGGIIGDNITSGNGGGVYNYAQGGTGYGVDRDRVTFIMNDGIINGNISEKSGGGLYNESNFIMNGGIITDNISENGGGVHNGRDFSPGNFTFDGGWIFNNYAETDNDVHLSGTFNNNVFDTSVGAIGSAPSDYIATSFAATIIETNVGQTLSASDLRSVEEIVKNIIGVRFKSVEKTEGNAPWFNLEEENENVRQNLIGDRLIITCSRLIGEEAIDVYNAVAFYFEFDFENYNDTGRYLYNPNINNTRVYIE